MTRSRSMRQALTLVLLLWLMLWAVVAAEAVDGASGPASSFGELGFPMTFEVDPGSRLYVLGERVISVSLTLSSGDTLCLNGTPISPQRAPRMRESSVLSEEVAARVYGDVPYVKVLLAEGLSASEAAGRYTKEKRGLTDVLRDTYRDGIDSAMSGMAAAEGALANARARDTLGLIGNAVPHEHGVSVTWAGGGSGSEYYRLTRPEPLQAQSEYYKLTRPEPLQAQGEFARESAKAKARRMRKYLTRADAPCCWIITYGGTLLHCGERSVASIEEWLDQAQETGEFVEGGPLPPHVAREIVERRQVEGCTTN